MMSVERRTDGGASLLRWFRKRQSPKLIDPDLGALTYGDGHWWGEVQISTSSEPVQLAVHDAGGRPAPGAWATIQELVGRYSELRLDLARELRQLLEPWHREAFTDARPLEEGVELLERFELQTIEVAPPSITMLVFSLKEGWDDAMFRVSLDEWTPRGVGVDD
jgi:hypothetical protein